VKLVAEFFRQGRRPVALKIRAELDKDDQPVGCQFSGAQRSLSLLMPAEVIFDGGVERGHSDHIALACVLQFLPWMRGPVTFPFAVSERFGRAVSDLEGGIWCGVKAESFGATPPRVPVPRLAVRNVSARVTPYAGGDRVGLSFGGGADSHACARLLGDVHGHFAVDNKRLRGSVGAIRAAMERACVSHTVGASSGNVKHKGRGGRRNESATYLAVVSSLVLRAQSLCLNSIAVGGGLNTCWMRLGWGFMDRALMIAERKDKIERLFSAAGLPLCYPVGGLTEITTMALAAERYAMPDVRYCLNDPSGPCNRCPKCFRKTIIKVHLGIESARGVDWSIYEPITRNLGAWRPFYTFVAMRNAPGLPDWVRRRIDALGCPAVDWAESVFERHYAPDVTPVLERDVAARIAAAGPPMNADSVASLRAFGVDPKRAAEILGP